MVSEFSPSNRAYFEASPCKNKEKGCQWTSILGSHDKHIRMQCKFEDELECEFCDSVIASDELDVHQNLTPTKDN